MLSVTNLTLKTDHRAMLMRLASLLGTWNQAHNLVSRQLNEDQLLDLLWEATAFEQLLPLNASIVDLGSGAGIPALPLALVRPDLTIEAVEPREKRCTWLRFASTELGCKIKVSQRRWDPQWAHFDYVVSRAVFPPETFCDSVGVLAPKSLQMTGESASEDQRSVYHVLRGRERVGLVLAGSEVGPMNGEPAP